MVPEEAIVSEGLRQIVYPVKDNKVERRVITIGQRQGGKVEVLDGLKAGETIVVLGVQRVRPGAEVDRPPGRIGAPAPAAAVPAANREQPSRSSLNVPQAIGSAQAAAECQSVIRDRRTGSRSIAERDGIIRLARRG